MPAQLQPLVCNELPFTLTEQQQVALERLWAFVQPESTETMLLLAGYAGVGKSSIIFILLKVLQQMGKRIALTAPTNQAVHTLMQIAAQQRMRDLHYTTIHQLLGLGVMKRNGEKVLAQTGRNDLPNFDLVVLDECSMVGEELWQWIVQTMSQGLQPQQKLILMGDPAQLNPVNEGRSPSFRVSNRLVLTQIVRQAAGNPLLQFATRCRQSIKVALPFVPRSIASADRRLGALLVRESSLLHYACKTCEQHWQDNPQRFRLLAWTDRTVNVCNAQIRQHLYGATAPRFLVGERLITREPVVAPDGKTIVLATSTEVVVREVATDFYSGYRAWCLQVELQRDCPLQIYVLHESETERFEMKTKQLEAAARSKPFLWRRYYEHLETFAQVRPCFAITVHNAQGSTFEEVGIMGTDLARRAVGWYAEADRAQIREHNRLWYVASTRSRTRVLIAWQ